MDTVNSGYVQAGQFIRARREKLGLSQDDMVREMAALNIETSRSALSRLESGESGKLNFGDPEFVRALAKILRVAPEDILAVTGHIQSRELRIDTRTQRIMEMVSTFDTETLETAEEILNVLAAKQKQGKRR